MILLKKTGIKTLIIANLINAFVGFIIIIQITNKLGVSGFGLFSIYQGALLIACSIFNFKLWEPLIISLNKRYDVRKIKTSFIVEILISSLGILVSLIFSYLIITFLDIANVDYFILTINLFNILFMSFNTFNAIIRYHSYYNVTLLANLSSGVIKIIGIMICSPTLLDISIIYLLSEFFRYVVNFFSLRMGNSVLHVKASRIYAIFLILKSYKLNITSILDIPVNYLDRFVIGYFLGMELTGLFTICRRISSVIVLVITSFYQHYYSKIIILAKINILNTLKFISKIVIKINIIIVLVAFLLAFFVKKIELFITLPTLITSNANFLLIMISVIVSCYSFIFYNPLYLYLNGYKNVIKYTFFSNLIYLIFLLILIQFISLYGVVISLYIQALCLFFLKKNHIRKCSNAKNKNTHI